MFFPTSNSSFNIQEQFQIFFCDFFIIKKIKVISSTDCHRAAFLSLNNSNLYLLSLIPNETNFKFFLHTQGVAKAPKYTLIEERKRGKLYEHVLICWYFIQNAC